MKSINPTGTSDTSVGRWAGSTKANVLLPRILVFIIWLSVVLLLVRHHAFWRDEVRALSVAKDGSLISMLESLRGEGHPALWFLLIRWTYFLIGSSSALWIASVSVASAAALLLLFRSPFGWQLVALFLFGHIGLFEYSVMARDYGISMLLMFLFAACYRRNRDHGVVLGGLLFLLANTHALSVLLAGAFLLFWLIDILGQQGMRWTPTLKAFLINAAIAVVGVTVCFVTIYPPSADAIPIRWQHAIEPKQIILAVFEPATIFWGIAVNEQWQAIGHESFGKIMMSVIMFGSVCGLVRSMGAFVAASTALVGFSLFFTLVFPGDYRHQALWLVFLMSLYWIAWERGAAPNSQNSTPATLTTWTSAIGTAFMVLLLMAQLREGFRATEDVVLDRAPQSRSRDFGSFIISRPDLKNAIVIADPDFLLEALPYYIDNPTYLMREQRFGNVVTFTKKARLDLDPDDILAVANQLHTENGKPVVILLSQRLDPDQPPTTYSEGYNWRFSMTRDQVRKFQASTQLLIRFAPAKTNESFDVYLFNPPR